MNRRESGVDRKDYITKQFPVSPASGKRIIAKSMLSIQSIAEALKKRTVVIVAGTTNGYDAEEMLSAHGQASEFSRKRFSGALPFPIAISCRKWGDLAMKVSFRAMSS